MRVFVAGTSFLPSYGGPAHSVSRLAQALVDAGLEVGIWAPDQSATTTKLLAPGSSVRRLGGGAAAALDNFGQADLIHDNGIWLAHNHALAVLARTRDTPRIVSTRGMLEPWAMRHKGWKKALAWEVYQRGDLRCSRRLHATAETERASIAALNLGVPVATVPNGVDLPGERNDRQPIGAPALRTALFLGRLYPVKGLPLLLEAWARVQPAGWRLKIAGPDESGHRAVLERAVARAGLGEVVSFLGPLDGLEKTASMASADLSVLPSLSESFGMAVAEALAHGLPVLTTTAVPWPGLEARGCGWRVDPTVEGLAEGLRIATACDPALLSAMGARGRAYVERDFGWAPIAERFVALYEDVLRERSGPRTAAAG